MSTILNQCFKVLLFQLCAFQLFGDYITRPLFKIIVFLDSVAKRHSIQRNIYSILIAFRLFFNKF